MLYEYLNKIKNLEIDFEQVKTLLNIPQLQQDKKELEQTLLNKWNDVENIKALSMVDKQLQLWQDLSSKYYELKEWVQLAIEAKEGLPFDLQEEYCYVESLIRQTKMDLMFNGKYDHNDVLLSISSGAGGKEAQDWSNMLLRMYSCWAAKHKFDYSVVDFQYGDDATLCKSAILEIKGRNVYGRLKHETGVHRLIRVSPFDSQNRRHTSFSAVEVIPIIEPNTEVQIDSKDIQIDTFRASGAGGQHVNKTESAIRITHLPTGFVVTCQNERSQYQNRETAMKILLSKLVKLKEEQFVSELAEIKGEQKQIEWGNQIRSYVFMPYQMVKDHRTSYETGDIISVMNGNIDDFIYTSVLS